MPERVTLTIDDKQVTVPAGTLVVDAAKAAGIDIPVFCSHPKLDPLGACRMCLVEFVTPRGTKLDTSCTVRVREGMVVRTDTEQVKATRAGILGFILTNHPLDCPICDKGGECPLQDQTMEYGPGVSQFVEPKRHKQKHYPINDLIMLDQERCILCWRCIRYLEQWEDKPQLGLFKRGGETRIDVFPDHPVDAKTAGNIIDICPVGALTNRVARFSYRPWELNKTPSICTLCPVGCNLRLDERSHQLRRIVARENPAVNDEWICDKGRFLHQYVDHPQRLETPLVRDGDKLRPATWDEALDRIVERLGAIAKAKGTNALGGIASARVSNEAAYLFQKFFRVMLGTNNVDFPDGSAVQASPTGFPAIADIGKSDLIVLMGMDPSEATPVLDLHLKRAILRSGTKLLIINPRRIELTRYVEDSRTGGGAYLPIRPGTEALILNGLAAAILASKDAQSRRRNRSATTLSQARGDKWAAIRSIKLDDIRTGTGLNLADLKAAAQILTAAQAPLFIYGPDAATGERGRAAVTALKNLATLLGAGDRLAYIGAEANSQGARDMGLLPNTLPGHLGVDNQPVRERLGKLWGVQPPTEPGLSYQQLVNGGVQALLVMGADPAAEPTLAEPLRGLDFLVVQDLFLTDTAGMADVVLPATSFAEADGTYTNLERRVQRAPQGIKAIGESRPDWAILTALAERWLAAQNETTTETTQQAWKKKRRRTKGGPAPKAWNYPTVQAVQEEIVKAVPIYAGLLSQHTKTLWEALGEEGAQWPMSALARRTQAQGGVVKPAEVAPVPPPTPGSFWLVSGPLLWDGSTLMQHGAEQVRHLIPEPLVALNPADLAATGLAEGSTVAVSSGRGTVNLTLRADASVQAGTAWVPAGLADLPAEMLGAGRGEPVAVRVSQV